LDTQFLLKDKRTYTILTISIFLIEFLYGVAGTVWSVLLPYLMSYYNKSVTDIGAATSLFGIGSIISVLLLMYVLDKFTKPRVLCLIVVFFLAATLLQGLAPAFMILPIAYFMFGSSAMAMDTVNAAIIVDIYGNKSKTYVNLLHGMFGLGSISGPLYAQFIIGNGLQWNMAYIFASFAIGLILLLLAIVVITNKGAINRLRIASSAKKTGKELTIKQFFARKEVVFSIIAIFFLMGAQNLANGWIVKYMKENLMASAMISTLTITFFFVGVTLSRFTAPLLYKKIDSLKLLLILLSVGSIIIFAAYMSDNVYLIAIGSLFGGYGLGTATPVVIANLCAVFPGQSGRAASFAFIGMGISAVVFSFLGAAIISTFGMKTAIVLAPVLMLTSAPFINNLIKLNRKREKEEMDFAITSELESVNN